MAVSKRGRVAKVLADWANQKVTDGSQTVVDLYTAGQGNQPTDPDLDRLIAALEQEFGTQLNLSVSDLRDFTADDLVTYVAAHTKKGQS